MQSYSLSLFRYFNIRVPYRMASEFCEMVTPCGNGPSRMGALASISSPIENHEVYRMVASFSQDNQMENEVWLGWNTQNPRFWEDGTPAYPNGFAAFTSQGVIPPGRRGRPGMPTSGWPVNPANPWTPPPGRAPVMKRQHVTPQQPGQRPNLGPEWDLVEATAMRAFVCEVAAGQNIPPGQQPGFGGQQPGFGGRQPGFGGRQPGFGGQQPGFGGQQPGFGGRQPGFGGRQPGFGGQQPGFGGQQPGFGGQQPGFGGQQPGFGGQQPGFGGQQPGFGGQQPGFGGGPQRPGMGGQPNSPNPRFNRPRMLQEAETDVTA
nr:34 kDa spicule matrix protein-like [Lytechinus pictus]